MVGAVTLWLNGPTLVFADQQFLQTSLSCHLLSLFLKLIPLCFYAGEGQYSIDRRRCLIGWLKRHLACLVVLVLRSKLKTPDLVVHWLTQSFLYWLSIYCIALFRIYFHPAALTRCCLCGISVSFFALNLIFHFIEQPALVYWCSDILYNFVLLHFFYKLTVVCNTF